MRPCFPPVGEAGAFQAQSHKAQTGHGFLELEMACSRVWLTGGLGDQPRLPSWRTPPALSAGGVRLSSQGTGEPLSWRAHRSFRAQTSPRPNALHYGVHRRSPETSTQPGHWHRVHADPPANTAPGASVSDPVPVEWADATSVRERRPGPRGPNRSRAACGEMSMTPGDLGPRRAAVRAHTTASSRLALHSSRAAAAYFTCCETPGALRWLVFATGASRGSC